MKISVVGSATGVAGTMVFPNERFDGEWRLVNSTLVLDQDVPKQGDSE